MKVVMNLRVPSSSGNFLTSLGMLVSQEGSVPWRYLVMFMAKFVFKCQMYALEYDLDLGGFVGGGQTLRYL